MSIEQGSVGDRYETKTIAYNDENGMEITLMITKFDGRGNDALEKAGWIGKYYIFTKVDGGASQTWNDEFAMCRALCSHDDDSLLEFCNALKEDRLSFDVVMDGYTYKASDLDDLVVGRV